MPVPAIDLANHAIIRLNADMCGGLAEDCDGRYRCLSSGKRPRDVRGRVLYPSIRLLIGIHDPHDAGKIAAVWVQGIASFAAAADNS
jgi:hypothetical protein